MDTIVDIKPEYQLEELGEILVLIQKLQIEFSANDTEVSFSVAAKYGNYVNCGTDNSSTCVQINNEQYGPYSDWYVVDLSNYESVLQLLQQPQL